MTSKALRISPFILPQRLRPQTARHINALCQAVCSCLHSLLAWVGIACSRRLSSLPRTFEGARKGSLGWGGMLPLVLGGEPVEARGHPGWRLGRGRVSHRLTVGLSDRGGYAAQCLAASTYPASYHPRAASNPQPPTPNPFPLASCLLPLASCRLPLTAYPHLPLARSSLAGNIFPGHSRDERRISINERSHRGHEQTICR